MVLGATGNVGGRIVQLLIQNPLCRKVILVTRHGTDAFTHPKVAQIVVNMDRLEQEVAPHAQGVDVALAAFGIGKGSAKMPDDELRKVEIGYPQAFCRAAQAAFAHTQAFLPAVRDKTLRVHTQIDRFAQVDLHPCKITNSQMGLLFEELIRKFAELSNETAGEPLTPLEVIRLTVNLHFVKAV